MSPACGGSEAARLPDPRQPRGRTQEVRQGQGPPKLPVLEALDALRTRVRSIKALRVRPEAPFSFWVYWRRPWLSRSSSMARRAPRACRSVRGWAAGASSSWSRSIRPGARTPGARAELLNSADMPSFACPTRRRARRCADRAIRRQGDRSLDSASGRARLGVRLSRDGAWPARGDRGLQAREQSRLLFHRRHRAAAAPGGGGPGARRLAGHRQRRLRLFRRRPGDDRRVRGRDRGQLHQGRLPHLCDRAGPQARAGDAGPRRPDAPAAVHARRSAATPRA